MSGSEDPQAQLDEIHAALVRDGYYVHPALEGSFTPGQLGEITAALRAAEQPTYVVAYPFADNDAFGGNGADLLARLHATHPDPGVYLTTTTRLTRGDYSSIDLEGRQYDVPGEEDGDVDFTTLGTVGLEDLPDLGSAFLRALELLAADPAEVDRAFDEALEQSRADDTTSSTTQPSGGSPDDGGPDPTGLVVAGVVLAVLAAAAGAALTRRRRDRHAARPGRSTYALPASAMERIRVAHDRRLTAQAEDELLRLGTAVDEGEIEETDDRASWQAALDHYDGARRLLERPRTEDGGGRVLDVVGALVLARRGHEALSAARHGRRWTPTTTCFLNPLHGTATATRSIDARGGLDAPLCAACRKDLQAGRAPDVLDVEVDGDARHYFETDVEPWASTGYGALGGDLVAALHRGAS